MRRLAVRFALLGVVAAGAYAQSTSMPTFWRYSHPEARALVGVNVKRILESPTGLRLAAEFRDAGIQAKAEGEGFGFLNGVERLLKRRAVGASHLDGAGGELLGGRSVTAELLDHARKVQRHHSHVGLLKRFGQAERILAALQAARHVPHEPEGQGQVVETRDPMIDKGNQAMMWLRLNHGEGPFQMGNCVRKFAEIIGGSATGKMGQGK